MPTLNIMPRETISLAKLSVSVFMICRIVLLCINTIIIGIIGYYFSYYLGSYRHNLFHEELMMLVCAVSAFINTVVTVRQKRGVIRELENYFQVLSALTSSSHQAGGTLSSGYAELISNGVSAFLLIIAGMVLLIQVETLQLFLFAMFPLQMSIHGKYFVAQYEAKVFSGVLALGNGLFYIVFSLFVYRHVRS